MTTFTDRLEVFRTESERIQKYVHGLSAAALAKPSACGQWHVEDVIAHLVGVADLYAASIARGLTGDTSAPPGRRPAGETTASLAAESIAQRSIASRQAMGGALLSRYDEADAALTRALTDLRAEHYDVPCYHPGGIVKAQNFLDLRLKELAVHEWDMRAGLEPEATISAASIPSILITIGESVASGSLRWAFWTGPALPTPVRYRFLLTGASLDKTDIVVEGGALRMEEPRGAKADVIVSCTASDYVLLVYGRLDLEAAGASRRAEVEGDSAWVKAFGQWFRGI